MTSRPVRLMLLSLAAGYWCLLFTATHWPRLNVPLRGGDKFAHGAGYFGLALAVLAVVFCFVRPRWPHFLAIFVALACYGALDEATQLLVPGRSADVLDWLADLGGAAMGIVAGILMTRGMRPTG